MRAVVLRCVLLAALVACSGASPASAPKPPDASGSAKGRARSAVVSTSAPLVKMAAGTDLVDGVLASWCEGSECSRADGVRPLRYLEGEQNGLLLFQASVAPTRAAFELRRNGTVLDRRDLAPGTMMVYGARRQIPEGLYKVVLTASWGAREGQWVFGVAGPLGDA